MPTNRNNIDNITKCVRGINLSDHSMKTRLWFNIYSVLQIDNIKKVMSATLKKDRRIDALSNRDYQLLFDMILALDKMRYFDYGLDPIIPDSISLPLYFDERNFKKDRLRLIISGALFECGNDETWKVSRDFYELVSTLYDHSYGFNSIIQRVSLYPLVDPNERANPYHDELGRFCSPEDAVFISPWANPNNDAPQSPPPSTLTDEQKKHYKEALRCSDDVITYIRNKHEAEIYVKAGLHEETINGRKCLIRDDIDYEQISKYGQTNNERMQRGYAPYSSDKEIIKLHHIGQRDNSPLAELTDSEHSGKENNKYLHDMTSDSLVDHEKFNIVRQNHWKSRSKEE